MTDIITTLGKSWARKHDHPDQPVIPHAPTTAYPTTLEHLIKVCQTGLSTGGLHAAGSHWALSEAAISDSTFIETNDPLDEHPGLDGFEMGVLPGCLSERFKKFLKEQHVPAANSVPDEGFWMPVHVRAGTRIYKAYSDLDDLSAPKPLNVLSTAYEERFAFRTLGGAGGQTVFGALTTGTHGGDIDGPPIADDVLAIHLVADGGMHYWIERSIVAQAECKLTDEGKLRAKYGVKPDGQPSKSFEVIYEDNLFNSVLMSPGRFGVVYSVVLRVVRQYFLHEERRLVEWEDVRGLLRDPTNTLYRKPTDPAHAAFNNKFLQIVVNVCPKANFGRHQAAVTKRWNIKENAQQSGRADRSGNLAGKSYPYLPDPDKPGSARSPSFLELACAHGDFMDGLIAEVAEEIKEFITSNGAVVGGGILAITATGTGAALASLLPALAAILAILAAFLAYLKTQHDKRRGEVLDELVSRLLNGPTPELRAAGIFVWQLIGNKLFASQQEEQDFDAVSYAVMDGHDYTDKSCQLHANSVEVFFDATSPMLPAFVDALLQFEKIQEMSKGKAFVGYIALRFMSRSSALIAPQRWATTCAVEVAGLNDVSGVKGLIDRAIQLALNPNYGGILHWGQRNESTRAQIEERFGDSDASPGGDLGTWRRSLAQITNNGTFNRFSNEFTRRTGLEIVTPTPGKLRAQGTSTNAPIHVEWDWSRNPVAGYLLKTTQPDGSNSTVVIPAKGSQDVHAHTAGFWLFTLTATVDVGGLQRQASQQASVTVV